MFVQRSATPDTPDELTDKACLIIKRRPADALEPHPFIESHGLVVLLIDVGRHPGMQRKAVAPARRRCRCAAGRVDEQRLHVAVVDEHECLRIVMRVHGAAAAPGAGSRTPFRRWPGGLQGKKIMGGVKPRGARFRRRGPRRAGRSNRYHRNRVVHCPLTIKPALAGKPRGRRPQLLVGDAGHASELMRVSVAPYRVPDSVA